MKRKKIYYEPEDDVLNIWISDKHYDHAEDEDGVIIHYTKDKQPVYIEILDASRFLNTKDTSFYKENIKSKQSYVPIPHKIK